MLLAHMAFKKSPKIPLHSTTNYQAPYMNFVENIVASGSYDFQRTVVHIKIVIVHIFAIKLNSSMFTQEDL